MNPEIIKDNSTYLNYLSEIERLMDLNPVSGSSDAKSLELLVHLVEHYESEKFPRQNIDPVDAILFRMDQANLRQSDLVPYLGSRSKVSEVLSRKRSLTLSMIQSLSRGLGIPAEVLLRPMHEPTEGEAYVEWGRFPVKEMVERGWISALGMSREGIQARVAKFFEPIGGPDNLCILNRSSAPRSGREMNRYSLASWTAWVAQKAKSEGVVGRWKPQQLDIDVCRTVARLSVFPDGPIKAQRRLSELGIDFSAFFIRSIAEGSGGAFRGIRGNDDMPFIREEWNRLVKQFSQE